MKWSYIAGFVDGEGSFGVSNHGSQMNLAISQREDRRIVFDLMAEKFSDNGISYSFYENINNHGCRYVVITISAQDSLRKLILKLMPFLIVKRVDAEAALEFLNVKRSEKLLREVTCKYGHTRTDETTYREPKTGKRSCLVCRQLRQRGIDPASVPGYVGVPG